MSTVLLTQITRTGIYPAQIPLDVTYNRGFISFVTNNWTAQMFYELPAIKLDLYTDVEGTMVRSPLFSRTIKTYNPTFPLDQQCSICISMKDVPANCYLFVTPIFDNNAVEARNELIRNGIETGTLWTTKTNTFSILLSYEDNNSIPTKTITQQPPISFTSEGTSIVSWSMLGNGEQSGTPTPDNPVTPTFCGVRTGNLCPPISYANGWVIGYRNGSNGNYIHNNGLYEWLSPFFEMSDFGTSFTISADKSKSSDSMSVYYYNGDSYIASQSSTNYNGSVFNNIPNGTTRFCFAIRATAKNESEQIASGWRVFVNAGNTALPYEPYGWAEKITCAGQTVPVYLGQVQTVRRVKKLVLTGEENIEVKSGNAKFYIPIPDMIFPGASSVLWMCSHYKAVSNVATWASYDYMISWSTVDSGESIGLRIRDINYVSATVIDFKSYLAAQYAAGTPVVIWYVLAEPQTGIINEPLAKIGDYADELHSEDAGVSIPTAKGQNTLTVDGTLQPSSMTITGNIK